MIGFGKSRVTEFQENGPTHVLMTSGYETVIGLTNRQIAEGAELRLMDLPIESLMQGNQLASRFRALAQVLGQRVVREDWAEVYFLDTVFSGIDDNEYRGYQSVLFFNDTAIKACERFGYALPSALRILKRSNLPNNIGTLLQFPMFGIDR